MLIDCGSSLNLIKTNCLSKVAARFPSNKKFFIGNEQHCSTEYTELNFQNKKHIFHIVPESFPLPEDGILGLPFFQSFSISF